MSTSGRAPWVGAVALVLVAAGPGRAETVLQPPPAPMSRATYQLLQAQPDLLHRLIAPSPQPLAHAATPATAVGPWQPLTTQPPFNAGAMLLLTDATVIVQDQGSCNCGSSNWWRLTPDGTGSYLNGSWSQIASLPAGYAPDSFASAVLPDGRVIVEGGEYNNGQAVWSSLGAIYDPTANSWTAVSPPAGMTPTSGIGDAEGIVLANGTFMLSPVYIPASGPQQLLDPKTLTWTATGAGKVGGNDEEGQALLPDGDVLTVDINDQASPLNSELFNPAAGAWTSAGSTVVQIYDSSAGEVGPELSLPSGIVLAVGATANNAVFSTKTQTWKATATFPIIGGQQYDVADGPAAVLPSGKVLIMASPGVYQKPSHFFVFNGQTLTQVADTPNAANLSSFYGYMLVLPTGQVMFNSRFSDVELYTDNGTPKPAWAPAITSVPTTLAAGATYRLSGRQLSGLSQGAAYGDDYQSATNYPLVRIVNDMSGHVAYARTFAFTSVSIAPKTKSSTRFALPAGIETGPSSLSVVANGIASAPVSVTVVPASIRPAASAQP